MQLLRNVLISWILLCISLAYCWDPEFIMKFIFPVARLNKMQELLWFVPSNVSVENSVKIERTINEIHGNLDMSQYVLNDSSDWTFISSNAKRLYIGIVFTERGLNDSIMNVHDRVLIGCHYALNIVVVMEIVDDFEIVRSFLRGLQSGNLAYTILYIQSSNGSDSFYGYVEFPEFDIENLTDVWSSIPRRAKEIERAYLDAKGYKFRSPLRQDVPYVFKQKDAKGNRTTYRGVSYRLIDLFVQFVNATLVEYEMAPDNAGGNVIHMADALDLVRNKRIDFLAHDYALFSSDYRISKTYPIMVVKWCLMVPIWNTVSTYFYPIQPFADAVWYAFLGTFLALALTNLAWISWLKHSTRRGRSRGREDDQRIPKDMIESMLNDFCYVLNISTIKRQTTPATIVHSILLVTVFFYGFFLSANYTSLLGSILTVNLFRENINTMDDLIRSNISIMIIDYELEFLLAGGYDLSPEFVQLLRPVDVATFSRHQLSLNASYGYFITDDKWHFLRLQQTYLKPAIFKYTDICFGSHHLGFALGPDSPIWKSFQFYILRMHSSGILQYYESQSFDYAVHAGLLKRLTRQEDHDYTSAGMQHLFVIFMLLLLNYVLSFIIFLGEHIAYRNEQKKNKMTKTMI